MLHVLEAVRGGTSRHLVDIVANSPGVHHTVVVSEAGSEAGSGARYDDSSIKRLDQAGARLIELPMQRRPWHPGNGAAVVGLRRLIKAENPDVVHGHSSVGGALARLAGARLAVPVIYTANGLATGRPYLAAEKALGRLTTRGVAVSASEARRAVELGLARPDRVVTIPNGVDLGSPPPAPDLRALLGIGSHTPLVGTVARLVPQKAPERFVRVAAEVAAARPDVHFVLIGMGPLQALVDEEVARAGGAGRLNGRLDGRWHQIEHLDDAGSALGQLDAFVLASRFEGAPYTPLEAMRAGVPVILSDVVGNRDAVQDGVSGLIRAEDDTPGMAAAVLSVLNDGRLRRDLVKAARERLYLQFDARSMGRRLEELYAEVAAEAAAAGAVAGGAVTRRRTRRLPQPMEASSTHSPESRAAQKIS